MPGPVLVRPSRLSGFVADRGVQSDTATPELVDNLLRTVGASTSFRRARSTTTKWFLSLAALDGDPGVLRWLRGQKQRVAVQRLCLSGPAENTMCHPICGRNSDEAGEECKKLGSVDVCSKCFSEDVLCRPDQHPQLTCAYSPFCGVHSSPVLQMTSPKAKARGALLATKPRQTTCNTQSSSKVVSMTWETQRSSNSSTHFTRNTLISFQNWNS